MNYEQLSLFDYKQSYRDLREAALSCGFGVRGTSDADRLISDIVVPEAPYLRQQSPSWRQKRSTEDHIKFSVGNVLCKKAVVSSSRSTFADNLRVAGEALIHILQLLDPRFDG